MAVITVPSALREKLGDEASESLVELLQRFQAEQKNHLIETVEERFVRRVVESENRLRKELRDEMHTGFMDLQKQIGDVRAEIGSVRAEISKEIGSVRAEISKEIGSVRAEISKEIGSVHAEISSVRAEISKEIADVRKEITVQTRWILAVLIAAAVLVPIIQRVMEALLP